MLYFLPPARISTVYQPSAPTPQPSPRRGHVPYLSVFFFCMAAWHVFVYREARSDATTNHHCACCLCLMTFIQLQ